MHDSVDSYRSVVCQISVNHIGDISMHSVPFYFGVLFLKYV